MIHSSAKKVKEQREKRLKDKGKKYRRKEKGQRTKDKTELLQLSALTLFSSLVS
jgi:hypothetical protein